VKTEESVPTFLQREDDEQLATVDEAHHEDETAAADGQVEEETGLLEVAQPAKEQRELEEEAELVPAAVDGQLEEEVTEACRGAARE
jgi:hypothetical protein